MRNGVKIENRECCIETLKWSFVHILIPLLLPFLMVVYWSENIICEQKAWKEIFDLLFLKGVYTLFGLMIFLNVLCDWRGLAMRNHPVVVIPAAAVYFVCLIFVIRISSCVFMEDIGLIYDASSFWGEATSLDVVRFLLTMCVVAAMGYKYWALISSFDK